MKYVDYQLAYYRYETLNADMKKNLVRRKPICSDADMIVPHISVKILNLDFQVSFTFGFAATVLVFDNTYVIGFLDHLAASLTNVSKSYSLTL